MNPETRILERLLAFKVEFVIVGGLAAIVHGATLTTRDIDVCLNFEERNLRNLQSALKDLNPKHRMTPQRLPLEINERNWSSLKNLYLATDWGVLDCLSEVLGIGSYSSALELSVPAILPFGECRVLSLDALIQAKKSMGRDHDLATVRQLIAIKGR